MVKLHGKLYYLLKRYIHESLSGEQFNEFMLYLQEETADFFNGTILSSEDYDISFFLDFVKVFDEQYGAKELEILAEWVTEESMRGIYGIIPKFMDLTKLYEMIPDIFEKLFSDGHVELAMHDDISYTIRFSGVKANDLMRKFFEWHIRRITELILDKKLKSNSKGIEEMEFTVYL